MKNLFIPRLTSNDESVKIMQWLVDEGSYVTEGQTILYIETSKTNVEIESESNGYMRRHCAEDDMVEVGHCFATVYETIEQYKLDKVIASPSASINTTDKTKFSNSAIKYIDEHQLNPLDYMDLGLVTVEKIKEQLAKKDEQSVDLNQFTSPHSILESLSFQKISEIAYLNQSREAITSSLTVQFETEMIRRHFVSVSWLNRRLLPYILYVFSRLLIQYPKFTSYFLGKQICMYNEVNLGIAVDLGQGLKVLVLHNANTLSLFELQMSLVEAIAAYHENSLELSSLQNSTVTVTDLSHENILYFQPVLNAKQSIILGIGGDQSLPGLPMTLTIVFDHRVLSGQEVASFLNEFKKRILTDYQNIDLEQTSQISNL